jgi:hypothetical protein
MQQRSGLQRNCGIKPERLPNLQAVGERGAKQWAINDERRAIFVDDTSGAGAN